MTITRSELRELGTRCRLDASGHDGALDRHLLHLADELDKLDGVCEREGIQCIYQGGVSPGKPPKT